MEVYVPRVRPRQLCFVSLRRIGLLPDGVGHLPHPPRNKAERFRAYEIGYCHVDTCELRTAQGKGLILAGPGGDRTSNRFFAHLYRKVTMLAAWEPSSRSGLDRAVQDPHHRTHRWRTPMQGSAASWRPKPNVSHQSPGTTSRGEAPWWLPGCSPDYISCF
jgi:hypothetical protein